VFLDQPVGLDRVDGGSITDLLYAPTEVEGGCTLYELPRCATTCPTSAYCFAPDTCSPLPQIVEVDGGEIDVTGSTRTPTIRLLSDASGNYQSVPPPGKQPLFAGGDDLTVADTAAGYAFSVVVPAPDAVALTSPDPTAPLHLPTSNALALAWQSAGSGSMFVRIYAGSADGTQSASIRCQTSDTGSLVVPADMIAALPAPPRSTRLEVERAELQIVATARAGVGVLLHASQTAWMNGQD
jgi:hypothetical protein